MAQNPKDVEEETLKKIVFLLSRLKTECRLATGYDEKQFFEPNEKLEGRKKSDWQQYYLRDFRKNLFYGGNDDYLKNVITYFYKSSKLNFAVGKAKKYGYHGFLLGNETTKNYPLVSMGAMRSSSALIANILSRPPFDSKPMKITLSEKRQVFFPGDYEVYFEYPLRTLIQDGKPTHPSMADAVLISRDSDGFVTSLIIIESKLMEYFFGKPPLAADTYLDETNYFPNLKRQNKQNGQSTASEFVSIFKEINQNIANGSIKFDAMGSKRALTFEEAKKKIEPLLKKWFGWTEIPDFDVWDDEEIKKLVPCFEYLATLKSPAAKLYLWNSIGWNFSYGALKFGCSPELKTFLGRYHRALNRYTKAKDLCSRTTSTSP
jgi:hypothetical protein